MGAMAPCIWPLLLLALTWQHAVLAAGPTVVGCYPEDIHNRQFGISAGDYDPDTLTPAHCSAACANYGYDYCAIWNSKFCFCKSGLTTATKSPSSCSLKCSGDATAECGDKLFVTVFQTDLKLLGLYITPTPSQGQIGMTVAFDVGWSVGPDKVYVEIDYGDGGGFSARNHSDLMQKKFNVPGEFIVTVRASNELGSVSSLASTVVLAEDHLVGFDLLCPVQSATFEQVECNATIYGGSHLKATVDFKDGPAETYMLADPINHEFGVHITTTHGTIQANGGAGIVIMPASEIRREGLIKAWRYHADTVGAAQFMILTPACSDYCEEENVCKAQCAGLNTYSCLAGDRFCPSKLKCDATCPNYARISQAAPKVTSYKVKHVQPVNSMSQGAGFMSIYIPSKKYPVSPGDILAYTGTGKLSTVNAASDDYSDFIYTAPAPVEGDTLNLGGVSIIRGKRHMLNVHIVQPVLMTVEHVYSVANQYAIDVKLENRDIVMNPETSSATVNVVQGIDVVIITTEAIQSLNQQIRIVVQDHKGSNVKYKWKYGDENSEPWKDESVNKFATHTYTSVGEYTITVTGWNEASSKENTTTVIIQEPVSGLTLDAKPDPIRSGIDVGFVFNIATGNPFTCTWLTGIGTMLTNETTTPKGVETIVPYVYTKFYIGQVKVTCKNGVNEVEATISITIMDTVAGLDLVAKGAPPDRDYRIRWLVTQGTGLSFEVYIDEELQVLPSDYWDQTTLTGKTNLIIYTDDGTRKIRIKATNAMGSIEGNFDFVIIAPISDPSSTVDKTVISAGESVAVTATVSRGTGVSVSYKCDAGSCSGLSDVAFADSWPGPQTQSETFSTQGTYTITVTIFTAAESHTFTHTIHVVTVVTNVNFMVVKNVLQFEPPETGNFKVFLDGGVVPHRTHVRISFGDSDEKTLDLKTYVLNTDIPHVYRDSGTFDVRAYIYNDRHNHAVSTTVVVMDTIVDHVVTLSPLHATINVPISLTVKFFRGCSRNVSLLWDFGDGSTGSATQLAVCPHGSDVFNHTYDKEGTYEVKVTAQYGLPDVVAIIPYDVKCLIPVDDKFTLTSDAPQDYNEALGNTVTYTLAFTGATLPTDAYMLVDFGDGQKSTKISLPALPHTFTHRYGTTGSFITTVTISNLASSRQFSTESGIYKVMTVGSVEYTFVPRLPLGAAPRVGLGVNNDTYPVGSQIIIKVSLSTGEVDKIKYRATSADTTDSCEHDSTELKTVFKKAGTYTIELSIINQKTTLDETATVIAIDTIADIAISESGGGSTPLRVNEAKTFDLTIPAGVISEGCVVIQYGDNSDTESYGVGAKCQQFMDVKYAGHVTKGPLQVTLQLTHSYSTTGTFNVIIESCDISACDQYTTQITVSRGDCTPPTITFTDPLPSDKPHKKPRADKLNIVGSTTVNPKCVDSKNSRSWKIERLDRMTMLTEEVVQPTSAIELVQTEMRIPARYFPIGLFRFTYTVEMKDTAGSGEIFKASTSMLIDFVKKPLVVKCDDSGASGKIVGVSQTIRLTPGLSSTDPELADGESQTAFDKFWYLCRRVDDPEFKNDVIDNIESMTPTNPLTEEEKKKKLDEDMDLGGCFQNGPGRINFTDGDISFRANQLKVGEKYEITAIVKKDDRIGTSMITYTVAAADPLSIGINCKAGSKCVPNSNGVVIDKSEPLSLQSKCLSCPTGANVTIKWTIYSFDYRWPWKPITDEEYKYVTGRGSIELMILSDMFIQKFGMTESPKKFLVELEMIDENGVKGGIDLQLMINDPPHGGNCTISPLVGKATDNFTLQCFDWEDETAVDKYMVILMEGDSHFQNNIWNGKQLKDLKMPFPAGSIQYNYEVKVFVIISDNVGAKTRFDVGTIVVDPGQIKIDNFDLDTITQDATFDSFSKQFSLLASALNEASSKRTYVPPDSNVTLSKEEQAEKDANDMAARNALSEKRAQIAKSFADAKPATFDDVKTSASTLFVVAKEYKEISGDAEEQLVTIFEQSMKFSLDEKTGRNEKESILANMAFCFSSVSTISRYKEDTEQPLDVDATKALESKEFGEVNTAIDSTQTVATTPDEFRRIAAKSQQRKEGRDRLLKAHRNMDRMTNELTKVKTPNEKPTRIHAETMDILIEKNSACSLHDSKKSFDETPATAKLPSIRNLLNRDCNEVGNIGVQMKVVKKSASAYNSIEGLSESSVVSLSIHSDDGAKMEITATTAEIQIVVPQSGEMKVKEETVTDPYMAPTSFMMFRKMDLMQKDCALHIEFTVNDTDQQLLVLVRFGDYPNITAKIYNYAQMVPNSMEARDHVKDKTKPNPYQVFLDNKLINNFVGKVYVGIMQLPKKDRDKYPNGTVPDKPVRMNFTTSYTIKMFTTSCYYFHLESKLWIATGMRVGPLSNHLQTECYANHLTSFAGGMIVQPNVIDFDYVFANADFLSNPTIYATEIAIFAIFILTVIWARRKDLKDVEKAGLAPLTDNDPSDRYLYEVIAVTGMRKNAGCKSKVYFILSGELEETDVRYLNDDKRDILQRGNMDGFLMSTPGPLGALSYVRIWHDNSGSGKFASWYLKYLMIHDVQTQEKYYFIANTWLAVEEADGMIDRVLPVSGSEQMVEFSHLFAQTSQRNLTDDHIWFSVIARPPKSRFTRVQRVSCCLGLLYLLMLTNAMFYEQGASNTGQNSFSFGPFSLSPEQISIGVMSNLIVFPVSFLLVYLFRKSRARTKRPSRINDAIRQNNVKTATSVTDVKPEVHSRPQTAISTISKLQREHENQRDTPTPSPATPRPGVISPHSTIQVEEKVEKKAAVQKFSLPWWCQVVAWVILVATVGASAFFVTSYGIMFGDDKSKKWITSMFVSFFMSVLITQPIKVFLLAMILSAIIRKPSDEDDEGLDDEEAPDLNSDEIYLHAPQVAATPRKAGYKPLDEAALEKARVKRMNEVKMWDILREISLYFMFIWILMVLSYGNRDPNAQTYKETMENYFITKNATNNKFLTSQTVRNTDEFWEWAQVILPDALRAGLWYNGEYPFGLRGYIGDKQSRIMGHAVLRQLRVQRDSCNVVPLMQPYFFECNDAYTLLKEDEKTYGIYWQPVNGSNFKEEYVYNSATSLDSYPHWGKVKFYSGGGYVHRLKGSKYQLNTTMKQLEKDKWIDRYTRAVFLEFTVYNPGADLFAICTMLFEFMPSGGIIPSHIFEVMNLLGYSSGAAAFEIACQIFYVLFLLSFIFKETRKFLAYKPRRLAYFHEFWNILEVTIIGLCIASIALFIYRTVETAKLTGTFKKSHGNEYIKFQYVAQWNLLLMYILGFLVFLGTLKFLRLLRFNRRMSVLSSTLRHSRYSLFHFLLVFLIIYLAYMQVFFLIYSETIQSFSDFIRTMENGLAIMMGKFDVDTMWYDELILTPIFFLSFVVVVTFILVSMFMAIMNESFFTVRTDLEKQANDYEIVDFILTRFAGWTGLRMKSKEEEESDAGAGAAAANKQTVIKQQTVDDFPERVDQLLQTITKAYLSPDDVYRTANPNSKAAMKMLLKSTNAGSAAPLPRSPGMMRSARRVSPTQDK